MVLGIFIIIIRNLSVIDYFCSKNMAKIVKVVIKVLIYTINIRDSVYIRRIMMV